MTLLAVLAAAAALVAPSPPPHAPPAKPEASDPHIRDLPYAPDRLVRLHGEIGFQILIEFAPDEHIENVSIGDGLAWQVTPNKRADLLFLKPLDPSVLTNMTVVTDQRRYAFELDAVKTRHGRVNDRTYVVHFVYPSAPAAPAKPAPEAPKPPERRNTRYTYSGNRGLIPAEVFDDGRFTYFRWPETAAAPAIFAVSGEGGETLVNANVRDGFVVVDQIAPRFVLRNGALQTAIFNDGWREPDPGPAAPKPHEGRAARRDHDEVQP